MSAASDKVLEILRRQHNGLTPSEMAADLATEGWQRRQEDSKKRQWSTRAEDGKKIKDTPKTKKSQIGEEVLDESNKWFQKGKFIFPKVGEKAERLSKLAHEKGSKLLHRKAVHAHEEAAEWHNEVGSGEHREAHREHHENQEEYHEKKAAEHKKKLQISEAVLTELRTQTLRSYVAKAVKSSAHADAHSDRTTAKKRVKGVTVALKKIQNPKQ